MVIHSLNLNDFRNYASLDIQFHPKINIIHGKNGQGKTNLIESIYFTTHLKSFRTPKIGDLCSKNKKTAGIQIFLSKHEVSHSVIIEINDNQKKVLHNTKRIHFTSDFIKFFYSLLFAPDLLTAFKEFPIERRNFFDRVLLLLDSGFVKTVRDYNRTKKQKNWLLRKNSRQEIASWNHLMSGLIPIMVEKRKALTDRINLILPTVFNDLTGQIFPLELKYRNDLEGKTDLDPQAVYKFLNLKMEKELERGFSVYGPHRDNFWLSRNSDVDHSFFSQGEYRASFLALQLTLNEIISSELDFFPIIILDDIFSELDQDICRKIVHYINSNKNQVFITSTDIPEALRDHGSSIKIVDGSVATS